MGTTALEKGPKNKKKKDRNKYEQTARLHGIGSNICTRSFPSSFLMKISFMFYVLYKFETEAWKNSEIRGLFHTECFDKYRQEKKSKAA